MLGAVWVEGGGPGHSKEHSALPPLQWGLMGPQWVTEGNMRGSVQAARHENQARAGEGSGLPRCWQLMEECPSEALLVPQGGSETAVPSQGGDQHSGTHSPPQGPRSHQATARSRAAPGFALGGDLEI